MSAPTYRFHHFAPLNHWEVYDGDGEVAIFGFDPHTKAWWIAPDADRFPTLDSLPAIFGCRFDIHLKLFGDVYAFFGVPLPGTALVHEAQSARVSEQRSAAA